MSVEGGFFPQEGLSPQKNLWLKSLTNKEKSYFKNFSFILNIIIFKKLDLKCQINQEKNITVCNVKLTINNNVRIVITFIVL